jgi:hypothetical protein
MVIDLEQYRRARKSKAGAAIAVARRYEEERMCVNWTPTRGISATFGYRDPRLLSPQLPDNLSAQDVEDFIDRAYGLASQI